MIILDTIKDAMIKIAVINPIDEQTPQDNEYAMRMLNRIIDSYNTQNMMVTYLQDITLPRPIGGYGNIITLGTGKIIDIPAPTIIDGLYWTDNINVYKSVVMTPNDWQRIMVNNDVYIPRRHYIQRAQDHSYEIRFDGIPQEDLTLHILAKMPYTGVNGEGEEYLPTDDIQWTRGFEKALMLRLAVELCSSYEIQPSQILLAQAAEAEADVKTYNYIADTMELDRTIKQRGSRQCLY